MRSLLCVDLSNRKNCSFYVYFHCRPDGTPFYVGKGSRSRALRLERSNLHHKNIVSKYGSDNILVELTPCRTEQEAYHLEQLFILLLREQGIDLANKSDGGEGGASGFKHSKETCDKHKLLKHSSETRYVLSLQKLGNSYGRGNKGKVRTLEQRYRNGDGNRGKTRGPLSEETKKKIGARAKERFSKMTKEERKYNSPQARLKRIRDEL